MEERAFDRSEPRVGIGMPVYNGQNYMAETIESILGQTYENFELLICDNASVDDTPDICRRFVEQDERVRYVRHRWNIGGGPNASRVIQLSRGEFFKLANHDDIWHPRLLESCVQALDQKPDAIGAVPLTVDIDETGAVVREFSSRPAFEDEDPVVRAWEALRFGEEPMVHFGVLRASVLAQTGLMPSVPSADLVLTAELLLHGRIVEVHEQLFMHREHPQRAVRAAGRGHASMAWWDPSIAGTFKFPYWRMMRELVDSVRRSPLQGRDRLRAYGLVARFATVNKHFLKLVYDAAVPFRGLIDKYYPG